MKKVRQVTLVTMLLLPPVACLRAAEYAVGADLSFLKQAEDHGKVFKDMGVAKPGLEFFKDHGYNWIRLRLFHTPTDLPNNLEYTIALAKDAKKLGYHFLLDYHYSDTWADPGKQFLPKPGRACLNATGPSGFRIYEADHSRLPRGGRAPGHGANRQ